MVNQAVAQWVTPATASLLSGPGVPGWVGVEGVLLSEWQQ
jgi:hypothetical protein